ncbi:MAG: methylmalonyl-CoA epimerase, partial [Deltaproteobacteria bacterium]|nr:methylmalonyl-CoA epimerase [Deltaproteobacteria bacterium]
HVALEVENIEESIKALKQMGIPLIDEEPRKGAHNSKIAFIHPKATQGVLIEMVQPAKE